MRRKSLKNHPRNRLEVRQTGADQGIAAKNWNGRRAHVLKVLAALVILYFP
jgi:hypothetical protein